MGGTCSSMENWLCVQNVVINLKEKDNLEDLDVYGR
jgi:hypothetical protein